MLCAKGEKAGQCYIEEVVLNTVDYSSDVFANLQFITDDNLAFDLASFAEEKGLTDIKSRMNEIMDRERMSWIID